MRQQGLTVVELLFGSDECKTAVLAHSKVVMNSGDSACALRYQDCRHAASMDGTNPDCAVRLTGRELTTSETYAGTG
jgi:hypothetical protein